MSNLSDERRSQRGAPALRKRYIRRAETLLWDNEFQWFVRALRLLWNERFPEFRLLGVTDVGGDWPVALAESMDEHGLLLNPLAPEPTESATSLISFHRAQSAALAWVLMMEQMCTYFFRPDDFVTPAPRRGHPARYFWYAALAGANPIELNGSIEKLIPEIVLQPDLNASSLEVLQAFAHPDLEAAVIEKGMHLPLFPGMTERDIEQAARTAADEVNEVYLDRTPWGRMEIMRASRISRKCIADILGMSPHTVRDAFRKSRR